MTRGLCALALAAAACQRTAEDRPSRADRAPAAAAGVPRPTASAAAAAAPAAPPAAIDDSAWLSGTWQKGSDREWLLFNPPREVGVLKGNPATMVAHGKYSAHGGYISVLLPSGTVELEADPERRKLVSSSPQATYSRGAAP